MHEDLVRNLCRSRFVNRGRKTVNACRICVYMESYVMNYKAIFLINGLCVVYHSLTQCLTLVYLGWGQKSEFFCLLVTTRRLRVFAGWFCKWATVALQQLYCST